MKWFKHISDSADDPDIDDAITLFGNDGYYVFFRTIEIMAREFDIHNPGVNKFSVPYLLKKYNLNRTVLCEILSYFASRNRIVFSEFEENGLEMMELNCPKLRDLCDTYTERRIVEETSKSRRRKLKGTLRIEEEEEEDKDKASRARLVALFFERLESAYERKFVTTRQAVAKGIKTLMKHGVSEEQIAKTIEWLATTNMKSTYCFVVQSGAALVSKWDSIQAAMELKASRKKRKDVSYE